MSGQTGPMDLPIAHGEGKFIPKDDAVRQALVDFHTVASARSTPSTGGTGATGCSARPCGGSWTPPIPIRAGPQKVSAAFIRTFYGPVNDLVAPISNSIADPQIGRGLYGVRKLWHATRRAGHQWGRDRVGRLMWQWIRTLSLASR